MRIVFLTLICFISGAIPYSYILGKVFLGKDIREFGDGNPGAANAFRAGGVLVGVAAAIMDFLKAFLPIFFLKNVLPPNSLGTCMVFIAPILGHAFTPFFLFKGGKAVATTYGVWMAVTNFGALPYMGIFMLLLVLLQRQDTWTVVLGFALFSIYPLFIKGNSVLLALYFANFAVLVYKHYADMKGGIAPRDWLLRLVGVRK